MKTLLAVLAFAGALTLGGAVTEQWMGSSTAVAQGSSPCFQNCANVRRWPAGQCAEYCRGKPKRK